MASVHRAFAQKLSKQHAADVRKNIATYQPINYGHISGCSSSVSLCDLAEPLDYEEFLVQNMSLIERDCLKPILDFPMNDIDMIKIDRKIRTLGHIVPDENILELPLHVRECIECYTRDWSVMSLNFRHLSSSTWSRGNPWSQGQSGLTCGNPRHEFQIDTLDSTRDDVSFRSDSLPPSRHSVASLTSCSENESSVCDSESQTPRGSWASLDLRSSVSDALIPGLLQARNSELVDQNNEERRMEDREECLFSLFPEPEMDECVERRIPAEIPSEHMGHRILVKCLQLKLDLEVEPIFASMALYDAKERKKVSENFYFDMNSEPMKRMLTSHVPYVDVSSLSRAAVFDITHASPDLFIVVRLEKVLQGDISECIEPYIKDDKNREKVRANAVASCERLGKYRMPFAWTAVYLMNVINGGNSLERSDSDRDSVSTCSSSNSLDRKSSTSSFDSLRKRATDMGGTLGRRGSLERRCNEKRRSWPTDDCANSLYNFKPITLTVSSFFKQESDKLKEDDLYKFLLDLKRPCSALKKLKCIPGSLKLDISPYPEELKYALTPELCKLNPYPDDNSRPVKEILEFPLQPIYVPHFSYRHLLYICPRELNFSSRAGSARNITVRVQLMSGESQEHALPAIFAKSSCPEFTTEAYTAVNYHNKSPVFYDEIKAKLPAALGAQHHLLFTFYHISCQRKPQETNSSVETPVGYSWLPIFRDDHINTGEFCLPVMAEPPPPNYSFISPDVCLPGTKWIDNHRPLFTVLVDSVTSVYAQDKYIDRFFYLCDIIAGGKIPARIGEENIENELKQRILDLQYAKPEPLVRNIVMVFDKLIQLLVQPIRIGALTLSIGSTLFQSIAMIVNNIGLLQEFSVELHGRQALLSTYISYQCAMPHPLTQGSTLTSPSHKINRSNSDSEINAEYTLGKGIDRTTSMRTDSPYILNNSMKIVHEEIALQWVVSSGKPRDLAMANSWFLFELMVKSMGEHLFHTNSMKSPRKTRFSHQYVDDITTLVNLVTSEIISKHSADVKLSQSLNASLAFFCFDLLSIMDRGFVFGLIRSHFKQITAKIGALPDATVLIEYKLDFLRILCSHEHFVALNLPFGTPYTSPHSNPPSPTPSLSSVNSQTSFVSTLVSGDRSCYSELGPEFRSHHFLVGLLLSELSAAMEIQNPGLHSKAVLCIRNLLACHDSDIRYCDHSTRARVAALYIPLLAIVMDCMPQLYQHYETRDRLLHMGLENNQLDNQVNNCSTPESNTYANMSEINQNVAMAIAGPALPDKEHYGYLNQNTRKVTLSSETTRHLLGCFLWVLKTLDKNAITQWGSTLSPRRLHQLLQVLNICIACFEYKGKKELIKCAKQSFRKAPTDIKSRLEDMILGQGSARSEMIQRRKERNPPPSPASGSQSSALRWRREHLSYKPSSASSQSDSSKTMHGDLETFQNWAAEASFIILDTLEHIVQIAVATDCHHNILGTVLKVLLHALSRNQSTAVLQSMFATQRSLVFKFHSIIFDEENEQCSDLCLILLKHCSSHLSSVRSHAAASLYLLMRQTFEIGNNFARVKMQVTMSLSSLVGTSNSFSEGSLRRSLKTILVYSEADAELLHTTFPEQVKDLLFNLHMILSDTVKMKEYQEDPEMLLDLMYRIAKGYRNSPDLRLTWLANMAQKHMERNNHTEAGMCLVHSAALVAEYLQMLESLPHLPVGAAALQPITPNAIQESAVSDDVLSPGDEAGCLGRDFTEAGLLGLLEHAASSFQLAGMFETMSDVYNVLIPIAKANRDYKKLANIHSKLHEAYSRIEQLHGKRVFGTYFRVAFFGEKFGDLDGQEFIYKEPTLTKLPEIFSRLENFYNDRFGPDSVFIIKDSNVVDTSTLNPDKAYIQITYVEPYFEQYEIRHRQTYFERNFNIKRFIFATPFTPAGRAHGELHEQCKRKTILTTANHFPYVKTRIQVIHRKQIVLSPIEVAIEDIQKKTHELANATVQEPPDPKILQMVLQGCIGTTVNQGPMEMALVFLSSLSDTTKTPTKHQNKLRLCFKDFSKKCHDALKKNKNLIGPDQRDYQRELERNYQRFTERLAPLITITPAQAAAIASSGGHIKSTPLRW